MNALKTTILLLLVALVVFPADAQKRKHPRKHTYDCKKVGKQKVHAHRFTKKEKKISEGYVHGPTQDQLNELARKKQEEVLRLALEAKKKAKEDVAIVEEIPQPPLPNPVYFRFDSDELQIVDIFQVGLAVKHAKSGRSIRLEGHTDNEGTAEYNKALSVRRAEKIKAMMLQMDKTLDPDKITIAGHGETKPAVANDTKEHRLENRRVEFFILH